jgi:hypothetical protein
MTINLNDLVRGGTYCLSSPVVAIGGTGKNDVSYTAPNGAGIDFAINGLLYHAASADDVAITAAASQPILTSCLYLIQLDTAGALTTVKGKVVLTADVTSGKDNLDWPEPTVNKCPIGAVRVDTGATSVFVAGTTTFNSGTIIDTFYSFFAVPALPLTS